MIFSYLKDRWLYLTFLTLTLIILRFIPVLYGQYGDMIGYVCVLILFMGAVLMIPDYLVWRGRIAELKRLKKISIADAELPERSMSTADSLYQELIAKYRREYNELKSETSQQNKDLRDTYVLWAHQIKTPIAAMRLLLDDRKDPEINEQLFHIEEYVNQLLYYFRSGSISNDFVIREYDADSIVQACLRKYSMIFIRKKLKLEYEPLNIRTETDEKWLGFVIEQILSNATKYTKSGSVHIYAENGNIVIRDTGIGIAPEDIRRIFEKGYTGLNGRQESRSTGLGLYLCKEILQKLGHDIMIEGEVGKGTKVTIVMDPAIQTQPHV